MANAVTKSEEQEMAQPIIAPSTPPTSQSTLTAIKILHVAWSSILLGIALEVVLLLIAQYYGTGKGVRPFFADVIQKVSWSSIVCVGLALGTGAIKLRAPIMGVLGLISAPLGFYAAKALHKGATQALAIVSAAPFASPSPMVLAGIKGFEYAVLGVLLGLITRRGNASVLLFVGVGLVVGVVCGAFVLHLMVGINGAPLSEAVFYSRSVNELLFPVGCSLVIFAAEALGRR